MKIWKVYDDNADDDRQCQVLIKKFGSGELQIIQKMLVKKLLCTEYFERFQKPKFLLQTGHCI